MANILRKYFDSYRGLPNAVWYLSGTVFICLVGGTVLTFLALYLSVQQHLSAASIGRVISVYAVGSICGGYAGGRLCDVIDSRRVLLSCLLLTGATFVLIPHFPSLPEIMFVLFVNGFFASAFRPAYNVTLSRCCRPSDLARSYSLYHVTINLSLAIGCVIGGFLSQKNFFYICWANGAANIAGLLFLVFFYQRINGHTTGEKPADANAPASPWKNRRFLFFCLLLLGVTLVFFQVKTTYPIYLNKVIHLSNDRFGILMALQAIIIVIFEVPLMQYAKRFPPERVAAVGAFLLCTGFALLPVGRSFYHVLFYLLVWTLGEILVFPAGMGLITSLSPEGKRGAYMAVYQSVFSICYVISPFFGGLLYDMDPNILWGVCGALGFLTFFGFVKMGKEAEDHETRRRHFKPLESQGV